MSQVHVVERMGHRSEHFKTQRGLFCGRSSLMQQELKQPNYFEHNLSNPDIDEEMAEEYENQGPLIIYVYL
jgi:hypothetical protein